jgi:anthranilate phosphoribosyltransferase
VLNKLGSQHVMVVHAEDGLDEISIASPTFVAELKDGKISEYTIKPEDFGFNAQPLDIIRVADATESLTMLQAVLNNKEGTARDIVVLNAGAAIYVAGLTPSLQAGVDKALTVIASGKASEKLTALVSRTNA